MRPLESQLTPGVDYGHLLFAVVVPRAWNSLSASLSLEDNLYALYASVVERTFIWLRLRRVVTCSFLGIVYKCSCYLYWIDDGWMELHVCVGEDRYKALGNWQDQLPANSNGK